ncbi:MAG: hypothetical protein M1501_04070 [Candidatus Omnitrophica bacterium]|nr:hypothetical protein [Candidatus Omnitrophota bacterium]
MKREKINKAGFFDLKKGFPDVYYCFTDGQVSMVVEKNGGINTLCCLDILEKDGKMYPDRGYTPIIFMKEEKIYEKRVLYGPAVQFISTTISNDEKSGRNIFHVPDSLRLYPSGFTSQSFRFGHRTTYDMAVIKTDILFAFTNQFPNRKNLIIAINKAHIFQGKAYTLKHQLAEGGDNMENPPFKENPEYEQKWNFIGFDNECNGFVMDGSMKFLYGTKPVSILFTSNAPISFSENKCKYFLTIPWDNIKKIRLGLTIAGTRQEALFSSKKVFSDFDKIFSTHIQESISYSEKSTTLKALDFPDVHTFSKTSPSFLKSMLLAETQTELCIRAATHKYGFFNLWDQVWPAKAFLLMGDYETAKKLILYPLSLLSGKEKKYEFIYFALFEILISEDIIAISADRNFENEIYGHLKRLFIEYLARSGQNGFLSADGACGVDDPAEIGINGNVLPCCLNSLWYDACRAMENLALRNGDTEISQQAEKQWQLIQKNYLNTFYNPDHGYLYSSVEAGTGQKISTFQNTATLGMDFAYGERLLYPCIKTISRFQSEQLYHPAGRSAIPYWDEAHEMWKNVIMLQHAAHEMRTQQTAGCSEEIERMMKVYLYHFNKNKAQIESLNLTDAEGDITQRANWQAFGIRAVYSGIFETLIGIQCDIGGFEYVPCAISGGMNVSNFKFRKGKWNINIKGKGSYVSKFIIDGKQFHGTMKIPSEYLNDDKTHSLAVTRGTADFKTPVLLKAIGAEICSFTSKQKEIYFTVKQDVHTSLKIHSPVKPEITLNGKIIKIEWYDKNNVSWCDALIRKGEIISIKI